jgi:predicted DNA-binding transcriptional regulator AlpA
MQFSGKHLREAPFYVATACRIIRMIEIITVAELAAWLKMTKWQVYEMTKTRTRSGAMRENPIPVVKINGNVRFLKSDIEAWVQKLAVQGR